MSLRAHKLFLLLGVLSVVGCSNNPNSPDTFTVTDDDGNAVATAKDVPAGTTIEECVDPAGAYMGEAYCPDQDGDLAFAVNSADPFNGTAPTCLCLSAGDPGTGWASVTTTAELIYDCAPADSLVGPAATTAYVDGDNDGLGFGPASMQCGVGEGTGFAGVDGDCNDADDTVGAPSVVAYTDVDSDGYGTGDSSLVCELGAGQVSVGGDCDDLTFETHPGAVEICNELDDDCDTVVDEEAVDVASWYLDADGDGSGDPAEPAVVVCDQPIGYVGNSADCNDDDVSVNPGAVEVCDSVDNDCDGSINEGDVCVDPDPDVDLDGYPASVDCDDTDDTVGAASVVAYTDVDIDGYGTGDSSLVCVLVAGQASVGGDCNDGNVAVNPGAVEVCDSADNDCDGSTDEDVTMTVYPDMDGDLYGAGSASWACSESAGWSVNNTDCNDGNVAVNPGASEISFNGIDDNCDGLANTTASATITVTPNVDQAGVSWELWLRDFDNDPTGGSTATWASGGAAAGTGPLTGTVTVTNGHVELLNGPMMGYVYWAAQTTGTNVSTTISVDGYSRTVTNTCWDGTAWDSVGCPGTDLRWTVDTQ